MEKHDNFGVIQVVPFNCLQWHIESMLCTEVTTTDIENLKSIDLTGIC